MYAVDWEINSLSCLRDSITQTDIHYRLIYTCRKWATMAVCNCNCLLSRTDTLTILMSLMQSRFAFVLGIRIILCCAWVIFCNLKYINIYFLVRNYRMHLGFYINFRNFKDIKMLCSFFEIRFFRLWSNLVVWKTKFKKVFLKKHNLKNRNSSDCNKSEYLLIDFSISFKKISE